MEMDRLRVVRGALLILGMLTAVALPAASSARAADARGARAAFFGGWELQGWRPWSHIEWKGALDDSPGIARQFQLVASPRRSGLHAARFSVAPGDKYGDSSGERSMAVWLTSNEREGDTYYYAWSTLFPRDWVTPRGWSITTEWHADERFELAPLRFNVVGSDRMTLDMTTGTCTDPYACAYQRNHVVLRTLSKGRWNDFVMRVHWSAGDGSVEVWHRLAGQRSFRSVLLLRHVPTLPSMRGDPASAVIYIEQGLYRGDGSTGTTTVYHDAFRRASTWTEAVNVWRRTAK